MNWLLMMIHCGWNTMRHLATEDHRMIEWWDGRKFYGCTCGKKLP